jgi:putative SOS response-associated peptidase YedK
MCGRFTQNYTWEEVYKFLNVFGAPRNLRPHYNIAPTTIVDVIRLDRAGRRELVSMRWGLIPFFWKKSLKEVPATFNARAETIAELPMFRDSFKRRRCIIPASGFFEWTDETEPDTITVQERISSFVAGSIQRSHSPAAHVDNLSLRMRGFIQ